MRDKTTATPCDANLRGRFANSGDNALPAPAATSASAAGHLPGRIDGPGRCDLPDAASASTSAAAAARWRTRLSVRERPSGR